jgi:hypothetical protein
MRTTTAVLVDEIARIDDRAPPGRATAMKNELVRAVWPLPRKAASAVPADRLPRRPR